MPNYTFVRKSTGETWQESMKISEMTAILEGDKDLDVMCGLPGWGDAYRLGVWKPDNHSQWKEVLQKVHKGAGKQSKVNVPG